MRCIVTIVSAWLFAASFLSGAETSTGGDFFDYIRFDECQLGVVVGDDPTTGVCGMRVLKSEDGSPIRL